MRSGAGLSLAIALVFGALAAFLVRGIVLTAQSGGDGATVSRTMVVTRSPLAFGAPLTAADLREVPWHAAEPLEGSFATIVDLLGSGRRLATVSMQRNEPVLASRITAPDGRATLSTQLEEGMRAVTLRVDEVRGVAGFVLPGDRVDVILTRGEGGQDGAAYADVLLQNAKVLAVDQLADERQDKPAVARAVTVELTIQQAQKVVLAQGIGRLSLALRQAYGPGSSPAERVTVGDLGANQPAQPDRLAEMSKELEAIKAAAATARSEAEREMARRLSETEARMRAEIRPFAAPVPNAAPPPTSRAAPVSVVTVTRNGSKTESYNVAPESSMR